MKRIVWLLLAVFSTAIAQVRPVDVRLVPEEKCDCCGEQSRACGMPDCVPTPSCARAALPLQAPAQEITGRTAAAAQTAREKFFVQFVPRVRVAPVLPVSASVAPAASVPLFAAHCSFLI